MEINVLFDAGFEKHLDAGWLDSIARATLVAQGIGEDAELGIVITGQEKVRELNRDYRGRDEPTDVLSFNLQPKGDAEGDSIFAAPPDGVKHLGEVIISYPQVVRQAEERGHPVKKEIAILIIHGVLHLLGYNHIKDNEADIMSAKEAEVMKVIEAKLK